jgi:fructoselysine-6-P-deglycase FrlB-like protein
VEPIVTPRHDESWCHTVAYVSPMLTVALGLGAMTPDSAGAVIAAELDARPSRREAAERLGGAARLLAVGSGLDEITASELALKIEEAAYVPTTPLGAEKVLHGHLPAADASTGVVLLRFDPTFAEARDARAGNVAAATATLGMPAVTLTPAAPVSSVPAALLAGALALQLLTLELAHVHGTNPDLIRREQDPYRAAAEAGAVG